MRRITLWALSTLSAVVLLFGYRTSTSGAPPVAQSPIVGSQPAGAGAAAGASTRPGTPNANAASAKTTVTGSVAQTQWGPVQVQITSANGSITDVRVLQYPSGNGTDAQINSYALPILVDETLQAQDARIDMVSGATVTSDGYLRSLQSALDQANL
jgi:uncharacterized protein with FMN-binding domain